MSNAHETGQAMWEKRKTFKTEEFKSWNPIFATNEKNWTGLYLHEKKVKFAACNDQRVFCNFVFKTILGRLAALSVGILLIWSGSWICFCNNPAGILIVQKGNFQKSLINSLKVVKKQREDNKEGTRDVQTLEVVPFRANIVNLNVKSLR